MEYLLNNTEQLNRRKTEIINYYSEQIKNINGGYTSEEMETFQYQLEEAKSYKSDNSIELDILPQIAEAKGITVSELVDIIIAKDKVYKKELGRILGEKKKKLMGFEQAIAAYHKHPLKDVHIKKKHDYLKKVDDERKARKKVKENKNKDK